METLKRIIYVYEDVILIRGHYFKYERTKDVKKYQNHDSLYTLYDSEKKYEPLVASTILDYGGLYEIARIYLTGDKQALEEAKRKLCLCY